jgi:hypothetical protein
MRAEPEMSHQQNDDHQQHQRGEIFCVHRSSNETLVGAGCSEITGCGHRQIHAWRESLSTSLDFLSPRQGVEVCGTDWSK